MPRTLGVAPSQRPTSQYITIFTGLVQSIAFSHVFWVKRHVNTNKREGVLKTVLQKLAAGDQLHQKGPVRRSSCLQIMHSARSSGLLRCVFTR
jgi:hypothetical protein